MRELRCRCHTLFNDGGVPTGVNPAGCPIHGLSFPSLEALTVYQSDAHVHALVHVIADKWMEDVVADDESQNRTLLFLAETLGRFEINRAALVKRLTDDLRDALMGMKCDAPEHARRRL